MAQLTPDEIMARVRTAKPHIVVLLKTGPNYASTEHIHMAHLQHIFAMREAGQQVITMPVMTPGDLRGIGVFSSDDVAEVEALVAADPAIQAGRLVYELVQVMGMPGDGLRA